MLTIPPDWRRTSIRSVLETVYTGVWGSDPVHQGNACVLRSTNLDDDGRLDYSTAAERCIPDSKVEEKRLQNGDLILETSGGGPGNPVGRVAQFEQPKGGRPYLCSNFYKTLRPSEEVQNRFLFWKLLQFHRSSRIWAFQRQTTNIINLNTQHYLSAELGWPEFDEQRRIARVLDAVDAAIRHTDRVVGKLDHVRQGLLHDLLTRGLTPDGRLRDPDAHPEQFRDSPLGRIPETWEMKSLEQVGNWASGGTPSKSNPKYWGGHIPWVTPKDMKRVHLSTTTDLLTEEGAARTRRVPEGTTFIVVRGMVLAHTFRVSHADREMAFNQDVRAIIPDEQYVTPEFLTYWFLAHEHELLRLVTEATHGTKRLDVGQLLEYPIAVPSKREQKRIVARLSNAETRIEREKDRTGKLQNLKRGLMRDLLTGDVRITDDVERRVADAIGQPVS